MRGRFFGLRSKKTPRTRGRRRAHRWTAGTCWVMQCGPPPPYAITSPGHPDDLAARIGSRDHGERLLVHVGVEAGDGNDHPAVADVEVHVAAGDGLPRDLAVGQQRHLAHGDPGLAQAPGVLHAAAMVGVGLLDALHQHVAGRGERGDQVDVAVGVAVLHETVAEPHDPLDAEVLAQRPLDLLSAHRRVAVAVEQTLLGREQRALAVGEDRAALQHELGLAHRVAEQLGDLRADRGVLVPRRELLAPGVEAEVDGHPRAVVADRVDRTAIAQPRVVERQLDHVDRLAARRASLGGLLAGVGDHRHRLERADRVGDRRVVGACLLEHLAPQLRPARPAHDRALVALPFGRCAHGCGSVSPKAARGGVAH